MAVALRSSTQAISPTSPLQHPLSKARAPERVSRRIPTEVTPRWSSSEEYHSSILENLNAGRMEPSNAISHIVSSQGGAVPLEALAYSDNGIIIVRSYSPAEGEAMAPITAVVDLQHPSSMTSDDLDAPVPQVKLRLVLGRTALTTSIYEVPLSPVDGSSACAGSGRWHVSALIPPFSKVRYPRQVCVPLTVQAMVNHTEVLASVTFGTFTYWASDASDPREISRSPIIRHSKRRREDDDASDARRPAPAPPQDYVLDALVPLDSQDQRVAHVGLRYISYPGGRPTPLEKSDLSLVRTTMAVQEGVDQGAGAPLPAVLEWVVSKSTPHPETAERKWSAAELKTGRRLVRFHRTQEGHKLLVSCQLIPQDNYDESDIVISCIHRPETRNCWFTSVDVIYLLERLIGNTFTVEEKNRIRRNLEGFKPTTVSKSRPGFEAFFQRIMDFPVPKPRNIEKDVKVFPWSVLTQALNKILSKYSLYTPGQAESTLHDASPRLVTSDLRKSLYSPGTQSPAVIPYIQPKTEHIDSNSPLLSSRPTVPVYTTQTPFIAYPEPDEVSRYWQMHRASHGYNDVLKSDPYLSTSSQVTLGELTLAEMEESFGDNTPASSSSSPSVTLTPLATPFGFPQQSQLPVDGGQIGTVTYASPEENYLPPAEVYNPLYYDAVLNFVPEGDAYGSFTGNGHIVYDDIIDAR